MNAKRPRQCCKRYCEDMRKLIVLLILLLPFHSIGNGLETDLYVFEAPYECVKNDGSLFKSALLEIGDDGNMVIGLDILGEAENDFVYKATVDSDTINSFPLVLSFKENDRTIDIVLASNGFGGDVSLLYTLYMESDGEVLNLAFACDLSRVLNKHPLNSRLYALMFHRNK